MAAALAGPDAGFPGATWAEEGTGHRHRERRSIRTAPVTGITWPHAAQIIRIRRDTRPSHGPWTHKEIAYGITSLPAALAGPRHLAIHARQRSAIENREHYVRDKTFGEDLQRVRTGNQPNAYAAIRDLVIGAFRHAGYANIAHARRYHARDDQHILTLYGYHLNQTSMNIQLTQDSLCFLPSPRRSARRPRGTAARGRGGDRRCAAPDSGPLIRR